MTKQKKIREGLETILDYGEIYVKDAEIARRILTYLHSQGAVIKVDRELPEFPLDDSAFIGIIRAGKKQLLSEVGISKKILNAYKRKLESGYVAVEPLIEHSNKVSDATTDLGETK